MEDTPGQYHDAGLEARMFGNSGKLNINATPFNKAIQKIDDNQNEDGSSFYNDFVNLFEEINKLTVPIKWGKVKSKPNMIIFGEMGNGKSSTGNALAKELLKSNNKPFKKSMSF